MSERALLAHFYPGIGEPLDLPVDEWDGLLEQLPEVQRITSGRGLTDREIVEREMARVR